jgi:hypothetical protein
MAIHQDASLQLSDQNLTAESPTAELPELILTPQRTPAKNLAKNDFVHMRSTSNKENMVPTSSAVSAQVDRLQTQVEELGVQQQEPARDSQADTETSTTAAEDLHVSPKRSNSPNKRPLQPTTNPNRSPSKTRQSTVNGSSSPRKSIAPKPETTTKRPSARHSTAAPLPPRASMAPRMSMAPRPRPRSLSHEDAEKPLKSAANIPHSKPRPMSMSFPTPPPPPKSTKPPTRSTFQLGGEAVAAKLKAAKEERQRRETEGGGASHAKSTYKPPTPTKSTKAPTRSTFQLPGEVIAARLKAEKEERQRRQQEEEQNGGVVAAKKPTYVPPPTPKSTKAPTKATFQFSSDALLQKQRAAREEKRLKQEQEDEKAKSARPVFKARPAPNMKGDASTAPVVRQTAASRARLPPFASAGQNDDSSVGGHKRATSVRDTPNKRYSIAVIPSTKNTSSSFSTAAPPRAKTSLNQNRHSMSLTPVSTTTTTTTSKGKEVFSRAAATKEAEEVAKKEKEDAARKARSEAAERGRVASREWAAKMKARKEKEKDGKAKRESSAVSVAS